MKRTIIAVISMVLILFAFSACRPTNIVGIPIDPTPDTPVTPPSDPSIPEYTIQVGDKTYRFLDDAISEAAVGSTIEIGAGEYRVASAIPVSKNLTIVGAGIDKTTITVSGGGAFTVTGDSFKISNLTISDESSDLTAFRSVINIGSTKATVDSVKITGGYSSTTENFRIVGIITNQNTQSVTITNSRFEGFRVPIETDNDLANGAIAALIKGNTFEDFDKVTFEYREEGVTIEDNTFVLDSDTDKSFQISLDWKNGTITPEQAKAVAEANDCVVQVLRTEQSYDAEGAVISTVDQLKAFAAGNAGSNARLINTEPITLSEYVTFSADNLSLNGEIAAGITVNPGAGFVIAGTGITVTSVEFTGTGPKGAYFVIVGGENVTIEKCSFVGSGDDGFGGIKTDALNTAIIGNRFNQVRIPFYFDENNKGVESFTGSATGNIVTDCLKIDLETASLVEKITENTITDTPVNILANGSADTAIALAAANGCTVSYDGITYDAEGALISTEEQLSKFASGHAGIKARLTDSLSVTTPIAFVANDLSLSGTEGKVVTVSSVDGFEINGNNILIDSISFEASGSGSVYFVSVSGTGVTVEKCKFTGDVNSSLNNRVVYGVRTDGENTKIIGNTFTNLHIPFYIDESNATDISSVDVTGNTINGCRKVDLETAEFVNSISDNTFTGALLDYDIEILEGGTEENAKTLSETNRDCTVKYADGIYPEA